MEFWKSILMGFVQGIAEFLPISSSGHLAIIDNYFKNVSKFPLWFDILLHISTLIVVISFFFNEFTMLLRGGLKFYKFFDDKESKLFWLVVIATIFTVVFALLLEPLTRLADSNVKIVGIALIVNSVILLIPYAITLVKQPKSLESIGFIESVIIGISQGIGTIPGISRSGITISTGLVLGIERTSSGVFSFLIFIPAVIGSFIYETYKSTKIGAIDVKFEWSYALGFVTALIVGYLALWLLMRILKEGKFYLFSIYTFVLGIIVLIF
ncbi:MAG: undecaprenyl-diphosphate phosphatase [Brevinematia bacterium]